MATEITATKTLEGILTASESKTTTASAYRGDRPLRLVRSVSLRGRHVIGYNLTSYTKDTLNLRPTTPRDVQRRRTG